MGFDKLKGIQKILKGLLENQESNNSIVEIEKIEDNNLFYRKKLDIKSIASPGTWKYGTNYFAGRKVSNSTKYVIGDNEFVGMTQGGPYLSIDYNFHNGETGFHQEIWIADSRNENEQLIQEENKNISCSEVYKVFLSASAELLGIKGHEVLYVLVGRREKRNQQNPIYGHIAFIDESKTKLLKYIKCGNSTKEIEGIEFHGMSLSEFEKIINVK